MVEVAVAEGLVVMEQAGQADIDGMQKLTQIDRVALAVVYRFKQFWLRREFLKPEPASEGTVEQSDRAVRGVHGADYVDVPGTPKRSPE